ncbi:MAG: EAL domain-containing protein [Campylobacterota bacterium]|nr:EAL domain-containing protein [Campylobacterota bacterium]
MHFQLEHLKEHNSELLKLLTNHLPDMLWVKDINGIYIYANKAICDGLLMAKDTQEPLGKDDVYFALREREAHKENPDWHTFGELCFNSDQVVIDTKKPMRFEEYGNVKGELLYLEVFKAPFCDIDGNIIGTVGAGRDITELKRTQIKLEEQKEKLSYQANYDDLTSLPNRSFFYKTLKESIENHSKLALLFLDLDNFKEINDLLGHSTGDKVLIETARRLEKLTTDTSLTSRLSGDEFCLIIKNIDQEEQIHQTIHECMDIMKKSFIVDNNVLHLTISMGISVFPKDGHDISTLLKHADTAMYEAKKDGKNKYRFYNTQMTQKTLEKRKIENELRQAFMNDQLEVYYQPLFNCAAKKLSGMEALVRWRHPTLGLIYPDHFIKYAETSGLIIELDRIVIQKAIKQFCEWKEKGLNPERISINLSAKQIEEEDFLDFIKTTLTQYPLKTDEVEFEITETHIMNDPELSINRLEQVRQLGINISVDDFGTGYSSLSYLKKLPIQKLKIDKSFIDGIPGDNEDITISKTIINLAKNLNLKVVAEGVETNEQKEFLLKNGCDIMQGYIFSYPLSATDMHTFLQE